MFSSKKRSAVTIGSPVSAFRNPRPQGAASFKITPVSHNSSDIIIYCELKVSEPVGSKNLILILDTSGSMQGTRLQMLKRAAIAIMNSSNPNDTMTIIEYNSIARYVLEKQALSTDSRPEIEAKIDALIATGTTRPDRVFNFITEQIIGDPLKSTIVFLTDGKFDDESDLTTAVNHWHERLGHLESPSFIGVGIEDDFDLCQLQALSFVVNNRSSTKIPVVSISDINGLPDFIGNLNTVIGHYAHGFNMQFELRNVQGNVKLKTNTMPTGRIVKNDTNSYYIKLCLPKDIDDEEELTLQLLGDNRFQFQINTKLKSIKTQTIDDELVANYFTKEVAKTLMNLTENNVAVTIALLEGIDAQCPSGRPEYQQVHDHIREQVENLRERTVSSAASQNTVARGLVSVSTSTGYRSYLTSSYQHR